ncbi:MAG: hypothetical protein P9X24_11950 [Candidatus Hatepunaea meridiana]|nr:hypothetical protein [Candidatus Hatepunaea meridiana]
MPSKNFVRSITIADCTSSCDSVILSEEIYGPLPGVDYQDWEPSYIQNSILSLYLWWEITDDLNDIADHLFTGLNYLDGYYSYLWDKIGTSYFEHVKTKVQTDTTFTLGLMIAGAYLKSPENQIDSMASIAVDILKAGVESDVRQLRSTTSFLIVDAYLKGHDDLKNGIDSLLNDPSATTRRNVSYQIERQQQRNNLLMEFDLGSGE